MSVPVATLAADTGHLVLGLRLVPLTLGHMFLLDEVGCSCVRSFGIGPQQLPLATFVCAQGHRAARRDLDCWWAGGMFTVWGWKNRKADLKVHCEQFAAYLAHHCRMPRYTRHNVDENEPTVGAPWHWRLAVFATGDLHLGLDAALDAPVRMLTALMVTKAELAGRLKVHDAEDRAFYEQAFSGRN